jgi:hypothetical protein
MAERGKNALSHELEPVWPCIFQARCGNILETISPWPWSEEVDGTGSDKHDTCRKQNQKSTVANIMESVQQTVRVIVALLIPIVALVMVFGTGMLAIYFNFRKRRDMFALYHQERMAAIEKGVELPPLPEDFFHEDGKGRPRRRSGHGTLLGGLVLLFVGLTLYLALHLTVQRTEGSGDVAVYALIPAGIGVACLIYYFAVGRKLALDSEAEKKAALEKADRLANV